MNELRARSSRFVAILAAVTALVAVSSHSAHAAESRSTLSVSVQVINPCEVTVAPNGTWISFGCPDASFEFSQFSTQAMTEELSSSSVEGVEFVDVTY